MKGFHLQSLYSVQYLGISRMNLRSRIAIGLIKLLIFSSQYAPGVDAVEQIPWVKETCLRVLDYICADICTRDDLRFPPEFLLALYARFVFVKCPVAH